MPLRQVPQVDRQLIESVVAQVPVGQDAVKEGQAQQALALQGLKQKRGHGQARAGPMLMLVQVQVPAGLGISWRARCSRSQVPASSPVGERGEPPQRARGDRTR